MKSCIFVDFDETLVNTVAVVLAKFQAKTGVSLTTRDITHWTFLSDTFGEEYAHFWIMPGLYETVEPLSGAVDFMTELKKDWDPVIITASHAPIVEEKSRCIEKLFDVPFFHEHEKWKLTKGSTLIDDGPHNIIAHVEKNANPAILFNLNNSRGWCNIPEPHPLIKHAQSYAEILAILRSSRD